MTTKTDERIARLEAALDRLEALGLTGPAPSPAVVDPDGYPGAVTAGEIIESAWGNAVATTMRKVSPRINGVQDLLLVQGNSLATANTDAAGDSRITFPQGFSGVPMVQVTNAFNAVFHFSLRVVDSTQFVFAVARNDGTAYISNTLNISWLAIGRR